MLAYRFRALTLSGASAAFVVGTVSFGSGGFRFAAVLLAFFLSSVALSRLGRDRKRALVDIGKGGPRDGEQVFANGAVATVCALLALHHETRWSVAFAGALAAATADTWGTEIGTLVRHKPRSILMWAHLPAGISGGVTLAGTAAEIAGAVCVAGVARAAGIEAWGAIAAGGIVGALLDSVLGASLQSLRWCPQCRRPCEIEPHACGANTTLIRGAAWFSNDAVNFVATLAGAATAYALAAAR